MVYLINACMCVMLVVIYCNWYFFYYLLLQVEERPSGELLSSRADYTTEDLGQNTADAFTATSEYQTRPEQDVGYDARCSKLVVGHTHCLPKVTNMDAVLIGVKMIQLSDSHKLSLCI